MKIAFHTNQLCIRGTSVALYDYALHNELILDNESFIISDKNRDMDALEKFEKAFPGRVFLYNDFKEVEKYLEEKNIKHIYYIKAGDNDGKLVKNAKNLVHTVFQHNDPHGEKYVYIAQWLANKMCKDPDNFIPHLFDMPAPNKSYREALNIPDDAIVLGRHGGYDEFNFDYTKRAIAEALKQREDLYFIFMNTRPFITHERVKYIEKTYDLQNKSNFINTCDGMIHGREFGEIFSMSIGEFLFHDKPIILSIHGGDEGHHFMVQDKGFWYENYDTCLEQLLNFNRSVIKKGEYKKLVEEYTPKKVMERFKRKFLDE